MFAQISKDDLIGCAILPFTDLTEGCFEGWKEIIVPFTTANKPRFPAFSNLKNPEIKLKVKWSVYANQVDCIDLAGSRVEEEVPMAHVDNMTRTEAKIHSDVEIIEEFMEKQ